MKTFSWLVNLETLKLNEVEKEYFNKDNQKTVFENMLLQALNSQYNSGVPAREGRVLSRVLNKLDLADKYKGVLHLEEAEFELVQKALSGDQSKFQAGQYRLLSQYHSNLEKARSECGEQCEPKS